MVARVCVGQIAGAHGVRGLVRLRSFTEEPEAIASYGPLTDDSGEREFRIELVSAVKGAWVARIAGVSDRDQAEALRGTRLYVARAALPEPEEDVFYHADLIGLRAELVTGEEIGTVIAVHDFGAGDVLEIRCADRRPTVMVPFTRAVVPVVELDAGRLVVDPPAGLLELPGDRQDRDAAAGDGADAAP